MSLTLKNLSNHPHSHFYLFPGFARLFGTVYSPVTGTIQIGELASFFGEPLFRTTGESVTIFFDCPLEK
jgi:hypothetical protein